jgi:glycosyltransferase involved in cell wall biosynthesis
VTIYVYPADNYGCGKYRMWWPAEALQAAGEDIKLTPPGDESGIGGRVQNDVLVEAYYPRDAELVVLQRPSHRWLVEAIPIMQKAGIPVVVDMDDDLSRIHPANPAFHLQHPSRAPMSNWKHAAQACRVADLVTVSTPALMERYAPHGRCRILPNCVPERFLKVPHEDNDEVGWAGAFHSHPNDPQVMGGGIRMAGADHCLIVGPAEEGVNQAFGIQCEATGLVDFDTWPEAVAKLGIGLAPLADTQFNEAKSWLKPLEYAACGVPWVGSPSTEYVRFGNFGTGRIASKPKAWASAIRRLRTDPSYRQELSEAGRMVAAEWTIEGNAWRWQEAWRSVIG